MPDPLSRPLVDLAAALRDRTVSATELVQAALEHHATHGVPLHAYKHLDVDGARTGGQAADDILARDSSPPPFCGVPISVKDLYGVDGMPTFAGTARQLPGTWSQDAWLVARLREQGAVIVGKTHTVELAYGAVGINPHWGTPRNPWDAEVHRIPGGSSSGAGVSLWEGSALVALGTDTGGSVRIPASMTGSVGHKTTKGRWPTAGVVPLSDTLDTVGALTRSVADSAYFFGAIDPAWGDSRAFIEELSRTELAGLRILMPRCGVWDDCQTDIGDVLDAALGELAEAGASLAEVDGALIDEAEHLYMQGGMAGAECRAFLARDLPGWMEILHPIVGNRLAKAPQMSDPAYAEAMEACRRLSAAAASLFARGTVIALPGGIVTPPPVADLEDLDRYVDTNAAALRPTCPVSILGLCAVTIPVGLDGSGMPVGLQLVAAGGRDEVALGAALAAERALGTAIERLGRPPLGEGS